MPLKFTYVVHWSGLRRGLETSNPIGANTAFGDLAAGEPDGVVGQRFVDLIHTEDRTSWLAAVDRFLAAMSHELRTSVTSIGGYSELLSARVLPPERRLTAVATISAAASHLIAILDDVLDNAKIDAARLRLRSARWSSMKPLRFAR